MLIRESNVKSDSEPCILSLFAAALDFRSVSVDTDQATCLANLMRYENTSIVHSPMAQDQKMFACCELVNIISIDCIFMDVVKLPFAGFHWAPRSLLRSKSKYPSDHNLMKAFCSSELLAPITSANGLDEKAPVSRLNGGYDKNSFRGTCHQARWSVSTKWKWKWEHEFAIACTYSTMSF